MNDLQHVTNEFAQVLHPTKSSIYAEQVFCSIVTQMKFIPQFSNQPVLKTVHAENYQTSYHRNTAAGNLHRLLEVNHSDEILILMTVECFAESHQHDKTAESALLKITTTNPGDAKWLESAIYWHNQRKRHLKHAAKMLYTAVGPEVWKKGLALAE